MNITNGGVLVAHNNNFAGSGTPSSTGALSADNVSGAAASFLFANAAMFDYHLMAGSPAIGMGVNPGSADAFSLTPTEEYVQPLGSAARSDGGKAAGAFEFGTTMGTGGAGSTSSSSGGSTASSSSGTAGAGGAGSTSSSGGTTGAGAGGSEATGSSSSGAPGSKGGCSCGVAGDGRADRSSRSSRPSRRSASRGAAGRRG